LLQLAGTTKDDIVDEEQRRNDHELLLAIPTAWKGCAYDWSSMRIDAKGRKMQSKVTEHSGFYLNVQLHNYNE
jgi:predicted Zn-ribbon and HTH transcriptional regulator